MRLGQSAVCKTCEAVVAAATAGLDGVIVGGRQWILAFAWETWRKRETTKSCLRTVAHKLVVQQYVQHATRADNPTRARDSYAPTGMHYWRRRSRLSKMSNGKMSDSFVCNLSV